MQTKVLWLALTLIMANTLQIKTQYVKQDSIYKKWFVGNSLFVLLGNQSIKTNSDISFFSLEENKKTKEIPNSQSKELNKILKEKGKNPAKQKNQNCWQINSTVAPVYYSSMVNGIIIS